ncbi:unnamed protein product [Closterium sp. NIES-54]
MGVGGAACAEEHDLAPPTALFTPSPSPPPQKCARVSTSPGMRLTLHPAQCPPGLKLKSACHGCGECGRGGGESKSKALLWGVSSLSQLQLILVFSALLLTASFLLSTRAIDLSAVDIIAAASAAGSGGDDAGGNGEYASGRSDPAKLLFVEGVGLGGGSWLLGGTGGGGVIGGWVKRGGGRGPWGRVSAGGGGAVGKVTRALVRGRDAEMAAMMAALDLSASEDLLVGGDMDEKQELRQRIQLVEDEWEYFQEAPYRLIDEFWRDVFDAAYDELVARDPTVHDKAVEEIARLSGKFYDVRTIGNKVILVPKGAAGNEAVPDNSDAQEGTGEADAGEGGETGADAQGEAEAEGGGAGSGEKAKRAKRIEQQQKQEQRELEPGQQQSMTQQQDTGKEQREGKQVEGQEGHEEQNDGTAERHPGVDQTVRLEQKAAERLIAVPSSDTPVERGQDTQGGGEQRVQRQLDPRGGEGSEGEGQWQQLQQRPSQPQQQQQLLQQEIVSREGEGQKGVNLEQEGGTLRSYGSSLGGEVTEATVEAAAAGGSDGRVELQGVGEGERPGEVGEMGSNQGREGPVGGTVSLRRERKGKRSKAIKQKRQKEKRVKVEVKKACLSTKLLHCATATASHRAFLADLETSLIALQRAISLSEAERLEQEEKDRAGEGWRGNSTRSGAGSAGGTGNVTSSDKNAAGDTTASASGSVADPADVAADVTRESQEVPRVLIQHVARLQQLLDRHRQVLASEEAARWQEDGDENQTNSDENGVNSDQGTDGGEGGGENGEGGLDEGNEGRLGRERRPQRRKGMEGGEGEMAERLLRVWGIVGGVRATEGNASKEAESGLEKDLLKLGFSGREEEGFAEGGEARHEDGDSGNGGDGMGVESPRWSIAEVLSAAQLPYPSHIEDCSAASARNRYGSVLVRVLVRVFVRMFVVIKSASPIPAPFHSCWTLAPPMAPCLCGFNREPDCSTLLQGARLLHPVMQQSLFVASQYPTALPTHPCSLLDSRSPNGSLPVWFQQGARLQDAVMQQSLEEVVETEEEEDVLGADGTDMAEEKAGVAERARDEAKEETGRGGGGEDRAADKRGAGFGVGRLGRERRIGVRPNVIGPFPPWVTGADEDNLPLTRRVQHDLWLHQHPRDCTYFDEGEEAWEEEADGGARAEGEKRVGQGGGEEEEPEGSAEGKEGKESELESGKASAAAGRRRLGGQDTSGAASKGSEGLKEESPGREGRPAEKKPRRFLLVDGRQIYRQYLGIGAQISWLTGALAEAVKENRIMVITYYERADHEGCKGGDRSRWSCYFAPETSKECRRRAEALAGDKRAVRKGLVTFSGGRFPKPTRFFLYDPPRWERLWGRPWQHMQRTVEVNGHLIDRTNVDGRRWWFAQATRYLMRYRSPLLCHLANKAWHEAFNREAAKQAAAAAAQLWGRPWQHMQRTVEVNGHLIGRTNVDGRRWWFAQATRYLMRYRSPLLCHLANKARHEAFGREAAEQAVTALADGWPEVHLTSMKLTKHRKRYQGLEPVWAAVREAAVGRRYVAVHVRQGDKSTEMRLLPLSAYLELAEKARRNFPEVTTMWLSTEMEDVVQEATRLLSPRWAVKYTRFPRQGAANISMKSYESDVGVGPTSDNAFVNLVLAAEADLFVGTLGSTWSVLIDNLRVTGGKERAGFLSVNKDRYWFSKRVVGEGGKVGGGGGL